MRQAGTRARSGRWRLRRACSPRSRRKLPRRNSSDEGARHSANSPPEAKLLNSGTRAPKPPSGAVPDIRFLLDYVLTEAQLRLAPVGSVGYSFGGWTALVSPDEMPEIGAVVALAPRRKFESEAGDSARSGHSGRTRVPRRRGLRACGCIGSDFSCWTRIRRSVEANAPVSGLLLDYAI